MDYTNKTLCTSCEMIPYGTTGEEKETIINNYIKNEYRLADDDDYKLSSYELKICENKINELTKNDDCCDYFKYNNIINRFIIPCRSCYKCNGDYMECVILFSLVNDKKNMVVLGIQN